MRFSFARPFYALALYALVLAGQLQSQTLGTFTGEVTDASGAAIADATVTVRNTATNGVRVVTTNQDGLYTIPALIPGMYEVKAEKPGFKTASRTNIELQVQQTARSISDSRSAR